MKNKLIYFLASGLLACFGLSNGAAQASNPSPLELVRTTVDRIVEVAEKLTGDEKQVARREELREVIRPHFDFEEMAKRSLGSYWGNITAQEQTEFVELFSSLLAKTYLSHIETVKRNQVSVKGEEVKEDKAVVKTMVENKGDKFPLDYKFMLRDGNWKVYDVVIENIGLVANYRNEFAGIIRKEKFEGLMQRLKTKSQT